MVLSMNKKKIELIIFDVDGLMLDTESVWQKAWSLVGEEVGLGDIGQTIFPKLVGISGKQVDDIVYQQINDPTMARYVLDHARAKGMELLKTELYPKPGVVDFLNDLDHQSVKVAVATTTSRDATNERLNRLDLMHHFDCIVCGDEVKNRKPDPEIYLKVLDHLMVKPQDALVLEDSIAGVQAAHNAGIDVIQIPDLIPANALTRSLAVSICDSMVKARAYIVDHYELI